MADRAVRTVKFFRILIAVVFSAIGIFVLAVLGDRKNDNLGSGFVDKAFADAPYAQGSYFDEGGGAVAGDGGCGCDGSDGSGGDGSDGG